MGLTTRFRDYLIRSAISDPNHWINRLASVAQTASGITVTTDSALKATAVYACIKVLADTEASTPLMIYRKRKDGGKDIADGHYLYPILHDSPNRFQTSFEYRDCLVGHLGLCGNHFSHKVLFGGQVRELIPLNPAKMTVSMTNSAPAYSYVYEDGKTQRFLAEEIWHLKNFPISSSISGSAPEGLVGLSPILAAAQSIGLHLGAEKYQGKVFSNASRPSGALRFPPGKTLKEDALKRLKTSVQEATIGDNAHGLLILEDGLEWQQMGVSNQDSQFLELRNFQIADIARVYRVPLVLIGGAGQFDKSATYASAEQFFLSFVVFTIRPDLVRIEQSINKYILTEEDRKQGYFAEHKIEGLLRGDIAARYAAYSIGRQAEFLSANEIRSWENLNPIGPEGDVYQNPNINVKPESKKKPEEAPNAITETKE